MREASVHAYKIPMRGFVESLNMSAAVAVTLSVLNSPQTQGSVSILLSSFYLIPICWFPFLFFSGMICFLLGVGCVCHCYGISLHSFCFWQNKTRGPVVNTPSLLQRSLLLPVLSHFLLTCRAPPTPHPLNGQAREIPTYPPTLPPKDERARALAAPVAHRNHTEVSGACAATGGDHHLRKSNH